MRGLLARLRRALNPGRILRITPVGRIYLVLTIGIGVGALNTGNNLLYLVLGLLLGTIVVSGILSERVIWDLEVRRLMPDGVFADEPFPLRYEVRRKRGQAFALSIKESGSIASPGAWAPVVVGGQPVVVRTTATAPRRGPWALQAIEVATSFPFGIFEKIRTLRVSDTLLVYPRRGFACDPDGVDRTPPRGDSGSSRHRDGTADLADLRELAVGEDARRIHWGKTATTGKLIGVEREREERRQVTLSVDAGLSGEELDRACEDAAGQTALLLARGYDVGLDVGRRHLRPGHGAPHERRILSALALVGFGDER
ncbi:MAG: DUF58 domain-containing protein [Myxococcaceae bacterium]|nr:DUF58 domain-containing protein [Myxococcaceae bacterium]